MVRRTLSPAPWAAVCFALAMPAIHAQTLNLRPGGWDLTMSVTTGGAAARVSPLKSCVTKEELEKDQAFQKDEGCVQKLSERTPTRYAGTMCCKSTSGQSQGTFEIVARTPETVLMTTSVKGKGPQGNFDIRTEIKGRWASASCKGYDD